MSYVYIVSDTRERHVHGLIKTLFDQAKKIHSVVQINTGDYLICRRLAGGQPSILACVERKTLKDFAASFKDGRYLNRNKMLDLRDKTGCQLYFFVEGPAFPKPTRKISRIPYGNILAAMTQLMLRDGIHVVQTENELGTAQRLLDFVRGFEKTEAPYQYPRSELHNQADALENGEDSGSVPELVTGGVNKSDKILAVEMWARLPGVSISSAETITSTFSVVELVGGLVGKEKVLGLRTAGGRLLIKKGRDSLCALRDGAPQMALKILSGIPGITVATAAQLSADGKQPLSALLKLSQGDLANLPIRQKTRTVRFGDARAERLYRLLRYQSRDTTDAEKRETDAPPRPPPEDATGLANNIGLANNNDSGLMPNNESLTDADLDDLLGIS